MKACLYECSTTHLRYGPVKRSFNYSLFSFGFNLLTLEQDLQKIKGLSQDKWGLYRFRPEDHKFDQSLSLLHDIDAYLKQKSAIDVDDSITSCHLLTQVRFLGYTFNPVCYYFVKTRKSKDLCLIEICNTFREVKRMIAPWNQEGFYYLKTPKLFYISPFMDMRSTMEFTIRKNNDGVEVVIHDEFENKRVLTATLQAKLLDWSTKNLWLMTLRYPFTPQKTILAIHLQAFILWLRKVPYFKKSHQLNFQKDYQSWNKPKITMKH